MALARLIKERAADTLIALGGYAVPEPTGGAVLRAFDWIDATCMGEGETTVVELARAAYEDVALGPGRTVHPGAASLGAPRRQPLAVIGAARRGRGRGAGRPDRHEPEPPSDERRKSPTCPMAVTASGRNVQKTWKSCVGTANIELVTATPARSACRASNVAS